MASANAKLRGTENWFWQEAGSVDLGTMDFKRWRAFLGRGHQNFVSETVGRTDSHLGSTDIERLERYRVNCSWPNLYYNKINSLIQLVRPKLVVEVGVAYGYHALHILDHNRELEYIGVDPYISAYDDEDLFDQDVAKLFAAEPSEAMNRLFEAVSETLKTKYGSRARIERMKSTEASSTFADESIEFIFIDGDHREDAVLADLESWWPKVKPGGVLAGDDYMWAGVENAVSRFFEQRQETVLVLQEAGRKHKSFWVIKGSEDLWKLSDSFEK